MAHKRASIPVIVCPVFVNGTHVVREMGRKGVYVVALDSNPKAVGFHSRYAKEKVVLPPRQDNPDALTKLLLSRRDLHGGIVIPTDDFHVRELHANYGLLTPHFKLAVSPGRSTAIALEKDDAYAAAAEVSIPVPLTVELSGEKDLAAAARRVGFPSILRAAFSLAFVREFHKKNFFVNDADELRERFLQACASGHRMMLQEFITGPDRLIVGTRGYAAESGELSPLVSARKLLQFPPIFGVGNVQMTCSEPLLEEYTKRLLAHIDFRGSIFGAEYKYDRRSGQWKFIELNCRSLMSTALAKYAGVDLLEYLLRDKTGEPLPAPVPPRMGRRQTYIKDALLRYRGYPEHRENLARYISLYGPPVKTALFDPWDLKPFLRDIMPVLARRLAPQSTSRKNRTPPSTGAPVTT